MAGNMWDDLDSFVTGGKEKKASKRMDQAIDEYGNVVVPEFENLDPESYKWLGDIDAGPDVVYEGVDPSLVGRSEMDQISLDPRLRDTQMGSLDALSEIADSGGLTLSDQANLNRVQSEVVQADRGRREAIMQNMRQRGMGGSGMELLSMLDSSQAATDRANQTGMDIAGMAQQRALDAIVQGGNVASGIRGQDFGEQADVAAANDAIQKFNAQNMNQANQFNAGNQLNTAIYNRDTGIDAQKFNTTGRQEIANANVTGRNDAQLHNKFTAPQQSFQNQFTKSQGKAGAITDSANLADKTAARRVDGMQKTTQATMDGFGFSDERVKKDIRHIEPEELTEFLQAVQPKKFKYRNPEQEGQAEGERVGFMLQDVADTKLGKAITKKDENGLLGYDKDNLNGIILAALSSLAKGA